MTTAFLRPLGRIITPQIQRFADKPRIARRRVELDLTAWVAEVDADPLQTASVTVVPAVSGGLRVSEPKVTSTGVVVILTDGVEGQDYAVAVTYATALRTEQQTWRIYVPISVP
ncbi:phage fiber-tail adaptor protein [Limobrevibacterium gyesilva]|uniref:Uncharacterized protein n=1 Tax=Limobrevibacterium gyesilva TaxID=2991712 RepID=A0AA42CHL3_9PROT|nr:hypothetical protein [Limobrevibacterium gyesilva]MCW3477376.1 hypothetical protein [Limobrevibacterium gyesilva]